MSDDPTLWFSFSGARRVKVSGRLGLAADRLRKTREDYLRAKERDFEPAAYFATYDSPVVEQRVRREWESACSTIVRIFEELQAGNKECGTLQMLIDRMSTTTYTDDGALLRVYIVEEIARLGQRMEAAAAAREKREARFKEYAPEREVEG